MCPCPHSQAQGEADGEAEWHNAALDFTHAMSYGDYLKLDKVLDAQFPLSPDHNEMLFIIQHYQRLAAILVQALEEQGRDGSVDTHRGWIEGLLKEYYDPMYAFQRQSKEDRVEFRGNQAEVIGYLRQRQALRPS